MYKPTLSLLRDNKYVICIFMAFVFSMSFGQDKYRIQMQGETIEIPENISNFQWSQMSENSILNDGYIGWIQFYKTPTQSIQDSFKENNLQLLEYIPNNTYLFFFPKSTSISQLKDSGVRSIIPVKGFWKLSSNIRSGNIGDWAIEGDNILVTLQFHENIAVDEVINDLVKKQIAVKQQYKGSNNIELSIPNNCLEELSNLPYVKWIELISPPSIKNDTKGRNLNKASGLDTQLQTGRNYTGEDINILVRDDGKIGPHIDFQGRIDNSMAGPYGDSHGDGVAGIFCGAGNLDPTKRGMAAGAKLYVVDHLGTFLDAPTQNYINNGTIKISNTSYGQICSEGYNTVTETVDEMAMNIPDFLNVFSAGNNNPANCGWEASPDWWNVNGGHTQGKNIISVANVFYDGLLVYSSSRGPGYDGRIKPEIAAQGQWQETTDENNTYVVYGGTSAAAPGVAGVSAQLYQMYSENNGGVLPPSALIKASLLNTTNEAGNIGPDFKFGWGIVNALRAGMLIEEERYILENISQGMVNNHTISIPSGTKQVRFMVYWNDPAATPGAFPALVNDLDLVVTDPSNAIYLPWILDSTDDPVALDLPATNGPDHLNNMEQVLINNPQSGNYNIEVTGFNVPMGPQNYFIVYEVITDNISITYPNYSESFVPGEEEVIYWDAVNTSEDYLVEYSINNGNNWASIATVPNNLNSYLWTVPNEITGEALIRITCGAYQDISDTTFSISNLVTNVELVQVCENEASFSWDPVIDANAYDIYLLGDKVMSVQGTSSTTNITIPITDPYDEMWYAVSAKNTNEGWESRRTIANYHAGDYVNCLYPNDLAISQINSDRHDFAVLCTGETDIVISAIIENNGSDSQNNFPISYKFNDNDWVTELYAENLSPGEQVAYNFDTILSINGLEGENTLDINIELTGDQDESNDEKGIVFFIQPELTQPLQVEEFDCFGGFYFPPNAWTITNPDNDKTWECVNNVFGINGDTTDGAFVVNYLYNAIGEEDIIETDLFNISETTTIFHFDLAKAQRSITQSDGLRVEMSIDCGDSFITVYEKDGLELSTIPDYYPSGYWTPEVVEDWRSEEIDISSYQGEVAFFRFININGYGNITVIDNISINGELGINDYELDNQVILYPNPTSNEVFIQLIQTNTEFFEVNLSNSLGQVLINKKNLSNANGTITTLDVSSLTTGLYFITINVNNQSIIKKLLVE